MRKRGIFAFGPEKLGLVCLRAPALSLFVLAVISAAALIGVGRIGFDDDLRRLFRSGSSLDQTYETLLKQFPAIEDELLLLIESRAPFTAGQVDALRNFHLDLQFVEGVEGVTSIYSAREPPDADGEAPTLIPDELPDGAALKDLLSDVRKRAGTAGRLLSPDHKAMLFLVSLNPNTSGLGPSTRLLKRVRAIRRPVEKELRINITPTGSLALRHDILETVNNDLFLLNLIGVALAIFFCFAFLGHPILVLIGALPPLMSVLWTIGGFGLSGSPLTAMNNVLPTLILVIAFCDSLHMVQVIRARISQGDGVAEAARRAVIDVGPACAMTSLTTMVACASLTMSQSQAVREFGIAGVLSVMTAYLAVIALVPVLSVLLLRPAHVQRDKSPAVARWFNDGLAKVSGVLARFSLDNAWGICVACVPLLLASGWLYLQIGTSYDYRTYLSPGSQANAAIDRINDRFGGADVFYVLISLPEKAEKLPDVVRQVHEAAEKMPDMTGVFSAHSLANWIEVAVPKEEGADEPAAEIPRHYAKRIASASGEHWLVSANIAATPAPVTRERLLALDKQLDAIRDANPGVRIGITGIVPLGAFSSVTMINGLKISLAVAVVIAIFMVMISAGSVRYAALSAIPNLLPLTLVASGHFLFGEGFQITSVLALTIAFGIAIDNTIHVLNRFRLTAAETGTRTRLMETISRTGPVLLAATLVLCGGLSVTLLSGLPVMRLFGQLSMFVLVLALLCAMVVLPALIRCFSSAK